jgi:hypothetical protein
MSEPNWQRLGEEIAERDWKRYVLRYELVCVPGLPNSAVGGLLEAGVRPADTAGMTDRELRRIDGVGPAAVLRLHSTYSEEATR